MSMFKCKCYRFWLNNDIDKCGTEAMQSELSLLQMFALQLTGISNVLEVMDSSFKDTFSGQLHDLHHLLENTLKAKQVIFPTLLTAAMSILQKPIFYLLHHVKPLRLPTSCCILEIEKKQIFLMVA